MLLARKGLSGQLIAEMCHCSPSSVRRTILERMEPHYRVAKLPKHLCFDEFRSTKSVMSFICYDAETHKVKGDVKHLHRFIYNIFPFSFFDFLVIPGIR